MARIVLATDGQKLIKVESPKITSGDKNADYLKLECCPSWDEFTKTAIFYRDEAEVYYAALDINDECVIPWEVLQTEGVLYFGVFGSKDDIRQTSEVLTYKIEKGAFVEDLKPSEPTPDIYDQLVAKYNEVAQAASDAIDAVNNHIPDTNNPHNVTAAQIGAATVARFTAALPVSGWSETAPYTQTVSVEGIEVADEPFIDVYLTDVDNEVDIIESWGCVDRVVSGDGSITAYCYSDVPAVDIPMIFKVVR